jgi:uncharacterized protein YkwD
VKTNVKITGFCVVITVLIMSACQPFEMRVNGPVMTPGYLTPVIRQTVTPAKSALSTPQGTVDSGLYTATVVSSPSASNIGQWNLTTVLDLAALQQYMLRLINEERVKANLDPVAWSDFAATVAQAHANEMAQNGYMSHWNLDGYGPDVRYSKANGMEWAQENVFMSWQRLDNGTPVPIQNWASAVLQGHESLMNSPGHRANILSPEHTHVGVGIAYNPATGEFRIAQEFLNQYLNIKPLPSSVSVNDKVTLEGMTLLGSNNPIVNLAYEPFPKQMTILQLNGTNSYASPATLVEVPIVQETSGGVFTSDVTLGSQPGLYHIRIFVFARNQQFLAVDWCIWVR